MNKTASKLLTKADFGRGVYIPIYPRRYAPDGHIINKRLWCVERERARITSLLHVQVAVCRRQRVQCEHAWYFALPGQTTSLAIFYCHIDLIAVINYWATSCVDVVFSMHVARSVVCVLAGHTGKMCKNGWTDRDDVSNGVDLYLLGRHAEAYIFLLSNRAVRNQFRKLRSLYSRP